MVLLLLLPASHLASEGKSPIYEDFAIAALASDSEGELTVKKREREREREREKREERKRETIWNF